MIPTRVGVLVAVPVSDDRVHVSWSKCNMNVDIFTELGLNTAIDRARKHRVHPIAFSMRKPMKEFMKKAIRYYKNMDVVGVYSEDYIRNEKGKILSLKEAQMIRNRDQLELLSVGC